MKTLEYPDGLLVCGDNLEWMKSQPDDSIDLIFGSPPYENARTYRELGFSLTGQEYVDWMVLLWREMQRIAKGLVAMVIDSQTKDFRWSAAPALLMADLHRADFRLRKPPIYEREGIPGTGANDWLKNRYEFIICTSKGKLPWSDNKAMGKPPKYFPGGELSYRNADGTRVSKRKVAVTGKGGYERETYYVNPDISNPGNVIDCGAVGGSNMGCDIAHEGDAPFPEYLAEFFIRSFCPPDGVVLDPFGGTGTTASVARQHRRRFVSVDVRESEMEKSQRRLQNAALRQGFDL